MTELGANLIERFPCGSGVVGYNKNGSVWTTYAAGDDYRAVLEAIGDIKDPKQIAAAFAQARAGALKEPFEQWGNVSGLIVEPDKVRGQLDLDDSYFEEVSLDEFEPMLRAWQKAWSGAQAYLARTAS